MDRPGLVVRRWEKRTEVNRGGTGNAHTQAQTLKQLYKICEDTKKERKKTHIQKYDLSSTMMIIKVQPHKILLNLYTKKTCHSFTGLYKFH